MGISVPGFMSYFTAHRSILASQAAMQVVNTNISNANTVGYSRQRLEIQTANALDAPGVGNNVANGVLGQGVQVVDVTRSHDRFQDAQIRTQHGLYENQATITDYLERTEGIVSPLSSNGINASMQKFFDAAHQLSLHADDLAIRTNYIKSAQNMLNTFQQAANQLQDLRTSLVGKSGDSGSYDTSQTALLVNDVNTKLDNVAALNSQIANVTASGGTPNDLLDKRDVLLEELSKEMNISVTYKDNNQIDVKLGSNILVRSGNVVNSLNAVENTGGDADDNPVLIQLSSTSTTVNSDLTGGKIGGLLVVGGNGTTTSTIRGVLGQLNTLFTQIATEINSLQAAGQNLDTANNNNPVATSNTVFDLSVGTTLSVFRYSVNSNIVADPSLVSAAITDSTVTGGFAGVGDGRNATLMGEIANKTIAGLGNLSPTSYFNSKVSILGSNISAARDSAENYQTVLEQMDGRRLAIQGVNVEEEMVDLMKYQRAFEASAKVLNTMDKVFDLLINRLV